MIRQQSKPRPVSVKQCYQLGFDSATAGAYFQTVEAISALPTETPESERFVAQAKQCLQQAKPGYVESFNVVKSITRDLGLPDRPLPAQPQEGQVWCSELHREVDQVLKEDHLRLAAVHLGYRCATLRAQCELLKLVLAAKSELQIDFDEQISARCRELESVMRPLTSAAQVVSLQENLQAVWEIRGRLKSSTRKLLDSKATLDGCIELLDQIMAEHAQILEMMPKASE